MVSADRRVAVPHGTKSGDRKVSALQLLLEPPANLLVAGQQNLLRGGVICERIQIHLRSERIDRLVLFGRKRDLLVAHRDNGAVLSLRFCRFTVTSGELK